jgi:hypothetical protein
VRGVVPQPTIRGYHAIAEIIGRMAPLADWYAKYKPATKVLTVRRRDLDSIQRYSDAAGLHQITTNNGVSYWRGFELHADKSPPRKQ